MLANSSIGLGQRGFSKDKGPPRWFHGGGLAGGAATSTTSFPILSVLQAGAGLWGRPHPWLATGPAKDKLALFCSSGQRNEGILQGGGLVSRVGRGAGPRPVARGPRGRGASESPLGFWFPWNYNTFSGGSGLVARGCFYPLPRNGGLLVGNGGDWP